MADQSKEIDSEELEMVDKSNESEENNKAKRGREAIKRAEGLMPGLMECRRRYSSVQPLHGAWIAGRSYFDAKTAVLIETLIALGAEVQWTNFGYDYKSDDEDAVASALKLADVSVYLWDCKTDSVNSCLNSTLQFPCGKRSNMVLDETNLLMPCSSEFRPNVSLGRSVCQELAKGKLSGYYGREGSLVQYMKEITDKLSYPENVCVVIGYNDMGKSCARALRSAGVKVLISEPSPIESLHAKMDGFELVTMKQAFTRAKVFVFATDCLKHILDYIGKMKDNSMICNIGISDSDVDWLVDNCEIVEASEIYLYRYKLETGNHVDRLDLKCLDRVGDLYSNAVSYTYTLWLLGLIHVSKYLDSNQSISISSIVKSELEEKAARLHL